MAAVIRCERCGSAGCAALRLPARRVETGFDPRKEVAAMARYRWLILALAIALVLVPGCAKKQVAPITEKSAEEVVPPPLVTPPIERPSDIDQEKPAGTDVVLEDVYFDFDKYTIGGEYKQVLMKDAEILMANPSRKLLVEGHCDERGTIEYNMALGEKRAKAVVDFFTTYGVKPDRITWISYGEEKPFDAGHDESAWAKNRRAHLALQ
jgi:peptidoglycan-associated lipoprotein